jgi:hypothetical protein
VLPHVLRLGVLRHVALVGVGIQTWHDQKYVGSGGQKPLSTAKL